ncbi:hypothetical protein D3C80_1343220 [compost metagenome]
MHPDLVGAAGLQLQLDPRGAVSVDLLDLVTGQGGITVRRHNPPVRLCRVTVNGTVDITGRRSGHSVYKSSITLVHRAGDHLLGDMLVAVRVLGDHQHARGLLIQPVNRPEAVLLPFCRPIVDDSVSQCIRVMPVCRVYNNPCGFVDYQQVLVFIKNVKGDILRQNVLRGLLLHPDLHPVTSSYLYTDVDAFPVQHNALLSHFEPGQQLAGDIHPLLQDGFEQPAVFLRRHYIRNR